ncbi:class II glutamine amidotransferase [Neisseriaceae bacterium ESL0693]|nr:class II glutamine amidotransferase [Neisseriaceae bacterium ESL0693]
MCQLLGMNCNTPTDIAFSFEGFRRRGGLTDHHTDGFGIAFFEGKGVRMLKDNKPCASSPLADLIQQYEIKSENVIAHIRKASQGQVALVNTHPFVRELWGEYWVFAHNGHLHHYPDTANHYFCAVGNTDSEWAFCFLLEELRQRFSQKPASDELFNAIATICTHIRQYGLFNFILSNGQWMIAHASTLLFYVIRQAPFGEAALIDDNMSIDFSAVTTPNDRVSVITTLPLTSNEHWQQLATNELILFENGNAVKRQKQPDSYYMSIEQGLMLARQAGAR